MIKDYLDFQNFVGNSHVRLAPPATQILFYAVYWCSILLLVGHYDFLQSSIGKFFTYPPRFLKRGQDKFRGTFQKYYLFCPFFFCLLAISLLLEVAGNTNAYV